MHYGIEDATHPYICVSFLSLEHFPSLFLLPFSFRRRFILFFQYLGASDPFGPLHFFAYAASISPLCGQGILVSHHFLDKSALYSFILHSDGFLTRGTRVRTKKGDFDRRNDKRDEFASDAPLSPLIPNIILTCFVFTPEAPLFLSLCLYIKVYCHNVYYIKPINRIFPRVIAA